MEGVVRGIQADMTKLSKSHSHTSNTVSKLLDKSRKLSVTMKEVRDKMERQGVQVKKLEANHAHLVSRNNFKVLIFQEENEIPSSVYVKDPPPFPREEILEEGDESVAGVTDGNRSQEEGLHTIDLSSDEDNIEKKMTKIGTKIVSQEQREKIKKKTSSLKVSPLTFGIRKPRSSSGSQPPDAALQGEESVQEEEVPFTEVHAQLAPDEQGRKEEEKEEDKEEEEKVDEEEKEEDGEKVEEEQEKVEEEKEEEQEKVEKEKEVKEEEQEKVDLSVVSEGVGEEYALSSTLPQEEKEEEP
ncbi:Serum deprivation-response protein [Liparis tanakae]|uniref:Serum deprivation-response protein n=1 Tax=Liparis tanakae TaxID=230148 RepID=A0A4Z2F739_9TELE|nr:Serum deprivation-response protein [Liparis tanakae]